MVSKVENNTYPKLSIISFCLNSGKYLRETIESVLQQTYKNFEIIVKDGGSTDGTLDILREYPQIRWVSEKEGGDNPILDAIWQAFSMVRGEYVVYLAVSDGIFDPNWFKRAVAVLDSDRQVSWVWGINQSKTEDGHLGEVSWQEYLRNPPPQKMDWLPFWFALQHGQETNAVFRRHLFEQYFPQNDPKEQYRFNPTMGFNIQLNKMGYLPYFLPIISFYGYTHKDQRQETYHDVISAAAALYRKQVFQYRDDFLFGRVTHRFRDGFSNIIHEVRRDELKYYWKKVITYRIKYNLRRKLLKAAEHIVY
ncbi:MAG TPA: glycosyltransferase [Syntrophales bacterium]|nr:glycosyltransferase [Syntrophales bacterium]